MGRSLRAGIVITMELSKKIKQIRNSEEKPRYFLSIKLILIIAQTNIHNYIPDKYYYLNKHYTTNINHLLEYKNTIKS